MVHAWGLGAILLASAIFAGCVDTSAGTDSSSPSWSMDPNGDTGIIDGIVIDDSVNPIVGAQIAVTTTAAVVQAVTDTSGRFLLQGIPPGRQTLFAAALGYDSVAKAVDVVAGQVTSVSLTIQAIPIVQPYVETFGPYEGYFECRMARLGTTGECGWGGGNVPHPTQLYPNDKSIFRFNITSEDYRSFVGDMRWQQGSFATSTAMRLAFSYDKRDSSHWFCSGEGPNPLQWRWEYPDTDTSKCASVGGTDEPDRPYIKDNPMRAYANVPFGTETNPVYLSLQQRFQVIVTVFYGEPAPAEFNGFPDA
ncbi:MAG TPA: carboxypeptidase-like regulatory domain-containing protein [Candidatus Thermoplasmatota archaeon]